MSENKHRIYELAKEYGVTSKEVMSILSSNDIEFKNHTSTVNEAAKELVENVYRPAKKITPQAKPAPKAVEPKVEQKEMPQTQPVSEAIEISILTTENGTISAQNYDSRVMCLGHAVFMPE